MKILSLLGISLLSAFHLAAQRGKNGDYDALTLNTIVNSYTPLTANATTGQTSLAVAGNSLTNAVLTNPLAPGDLILIIQMQGATMDIDVIPATPVAQGGWGSEYTSVIGHADWYNYLDAWGQVTNYNNAGKYEYAQVAGITGSTGITLSCGLVNNYTASGKVQVVRVPRFSDLSVGSAGSIVPAAWDGTTGGVVAIEVDGNLSFASGGKIDASGKGFRGGQESDNVSTSAGAGSVNDTPYPATYVSSLASEKGEGIGGSMTEYAVLYSQYGVSAPANGGGGAHHHNSGGGGGSNVGTGTYTGKGVPDPAYNTMWNLEVPAIGGVNSSGGGRGGYSYSNSNQNEATVGPNQLPWAGDYRRNNGGRGGHPLTLDATRIFMGGGGGAGDQDNNQGGAGGAGGGIVMLQVFGTTSATDPVLSAIMVNGANGISANANNATAIANQKLGNDGAGGGGGGGAILVSHNGTFPAGLGLYAKGGSGGSQNLSLGPFATVNEADGPGGGGAGGQISITAGTPTNAVTGGINGITNSSHVNTFPPNGATSGSSGISNTGVNFYDLVVQNDTICGNGSSTLNVTVTGTLPAGATVYWYTDPFGGTSFNTGLTYTTPVLNATTTYYVGTCPGDFRKPVQVIIGSNPVISGTPVISAVTCAGNDGSITGLTVSAGTPGYAYSWNGNTTASADLTNAIAGNYTLTVTDATGCTATSGPHQISSAGGPVIDTDLISITSATCAGNDGSIMGITQTGGINFHWNNGGGTNLDATNLPAGTYTLTVTDASSCAATAGPYIITEPAGPSVNITNIEIIPENCGQSNGSISGITAAGTGITYSWTNSTTTTIDISSLNAGDYALTVTDDQGCSVTSGPYTITDNQGPSINVTALVITPETCNLNNGQIEGIAITGGTAPVNFSWTNTAQTTLDLAGLDAGSYTLTVTDGNGCTATSGPHLVTNAPLPVINDANVAITNESCAGNDGSITGITVSGTGLTYSWNGVDGPLNLTNATAGTYNLVVTDGNNCTASDGPYVIGGSTPLSLDMTNAAATNTACNANTASITGIVITGGINPVFTWSNNATTLNQAGLAAGSYTITVNDDQGCTDTETLAIVNGPGPAIVLSSLVLIQPSCGASNGSIQGLGFAGTATYSWTGTTQTTLDLSGLSPGSYALTATGTDGCQSVTGPFIMNSSTGPTANFTYSPTEVKPGDLVQFTDLSSSDVISWDWLIDGQAFTTDNPVTSFAAEGSYTAVLVVTSASGCNATVTKIIEVFDAMTIPNVMTMNNDGVNDKFEIRGIQPNTEVQIVNRWGNLVFKSSNYLNDWTGADLNGEKLSNGVYTYYIRTAKGEFKQGFVHLID